MLAFLGKLDLVSKMAWTQLIIEKHMEKLAEQINNDLIYGVDDVKRQFQGLKGQIDAFVEEEKKGP
jgi:hypothetical protein